MTVLDDRPIGQIGVDISVWGGYNNCMDKKMMTINISLPVSLYNQTKKQAKKYHYVSTSELIRDALRWWLNDSLTRNGFTPEFEDQVLKAEKEPVGNDIEWDGKTPFGEWSQTHLPPKLYAKNKSYSKVLSSRKRIIRGKSESERRSQQESTLVL